MSRHSFLHILLCFITSLISYTAADFTWDSFPSCAKPILEHYAPGTCDLGLTGNDLNRTHVCLCSNREFLDSTAVAVYIVCGCDDLRLTANRLTENCNGTNTPAISTLTEYIAIGNGGLGSCAPAVFSVRAENSSQSSPNNCSSSTTSTPNQQRCPKTDLIVALAVGIPATLVASFAAFVTTLQLLVYQQRLPQDASPWPIIRASFRHWFCCHFPRRRKPSQPAVAEAELSHVPP